MKVFVAGASGALGVPFIKELLEHGHHVTAMARSANVAPKKYEGSIKFVQVNAFDKQAVNEAVQRSSPDAVVDLLTSLPKNPAELMNAFAHDRKLRLEGGSNLYTTAIAAGVKRYVQQSSGFYLDAAQGKLATEDDSFQQNASPNIALGCQMLRTLEARVFSDARIEGIALRYGFFYGPGTWYWSDGGAADLVRQQTYPVVGEGRAINSFIHVQDAAVATLAALHADPGIYNIVDDDPISVAEWVPAFAHFVGAPTPSRISEEEALKTMGPDAVFYHNGLKGASNDKAKVKLHFRPRRLEWLPPAI
jgi:nucleoside-diphosphate-sugar epimerase